MMRKSTRWFRSAVQTALTVLLMTATFASVAHKAAAQACGPDPKLSIVVTTRFDDISVRSDYAVTEIEALAHKLSARTLPEIFGFYTSEFGYTINIAASPACAGLTQATVTLLLSRRVIEVGKDFAAGSCTSEAIVAHYRRMAEADEREVTRFARRTTATLGAATAAIRTVPAEQSELLRQRIKAIVDEATVPLHEARRSAQEALNTPDELTKVKSTCAA